VLVNPTASAVAVRLGASYYTLDGLLATTVELAPDTAQILTA
jgi:hypothetical protein